MRDDVLHYLKTKPIKLCVLATASTTGKPESAVVGYAVKDDLTMLFSTHKGTRKLDNLNKNNQISLVVGWDFDTMNVQMEGTAKIVENENEHKAAEDFFFTQNPAALKFKSPDTVFIEVLPHWVRSIDPRQHPPKTEEIPL